MKRALLLLLASLLAACADPAPTVHSTLETNYTRTVAPDGTIHGFGQGAPP